MTTPFPRSLKRSVLAIGGAALLAASSLGSAYAQAAPSAGTTLSQTQTQTQPSTRPTTASHHGHRLRKFMRTELRVAAEFIGIDRKQLRTELKGTTLAAVATAHNVAPEELARVLKADVDAKIDAAVAAGRLSADRAAKLKERASTRVDAWMTRRFGLGTRKS
jgi:hypothetical protein